ncbi:hypothetical protein AVEN_253989-1 [Araneus ventricosus]|uniref:Uncharacterized protein n=1 Tax=Araneus ventricosus TaxID=182803 RepID=A0A4Y2GN65_ARAVE|nr:hypothetical protein AVEN_253989-1 [Araneus ventricosus]
MKMPSLGNPQNDGLFHSSIKLYSASDFDQTGKDLFLVQILFLEIPVQTDANLLSAHTNPEKNSHKDFFLKSTAFPLMIPEQTYLSLYLSLAYQPTTVNGLDPH